MLLTTLLAYPVSILAVMVIVAGLMLAKAARDALRPSTSAELRALPVFVATVVPILLWNTLGGFLIGLAVAGAIAASSRWWRR
jgi:hypothetical protein